MTAPPPDSFAARHLGPSPVELRQMAATLGFDSLEALVDRAVPAAIRLREPLHQLPPPRTEAEALAELKAILGRNRVLRSCIGAGYHDCFTPPVIQRNVLENPGWYSAYTPYQAEISQGRLEALLNFQTMIVELTGLEIANASLLDEATAAAEAMHLCHAIRGPAHPHRFFVSETCHPQTIAVLATHARAAGIEIVGGDHRQFQCDQRVFGVLLQYPATDGAIYDYAEFIRAAHHCQALAVVAADPLSLALLKPPGDFGADVAVGSTQRFGVPLGYGGPHAAYFATRALHQRRLPGRLVGVSQDAQGRPALRLALQTREQHIRREKATSNICTAEVLPAVLASMYAVWHGPAGLQRIADRAHYFACRFAAILQRSGYSVGEAPFFDTLRVHCSESSSPPSRNAAVAAGRSAALVLESAAKLGFNLRPLDPQSIGIAFDETTTESDLDRLCQAFGVTGDNISPADISAGLPASLRRESPCLSHPVFHRYHTEHEMLRYLKRLESRDLSLTTSMIPLGSCTMKLNATAEMLPLSWPEAARLHPFAPPDQAAGFRELVAQLERQLAHLTGFSAVSFQPNAGSQGEYTGLLVIREHHRRHGQPQRNVCLIPVSAHGTNFASAARAGLEVIAVNCDPQGNIDTADLREKAFACRDSLAALMVTYPSTHGVFEENICEVCDLVHQHGGQVYLDGANLNALLGLSRPASFGADVCHLNLHKTFCIPHGGGGPGLGPIAVAPHLAPFLPTHPVIPTGGTQPIGPVSAAPWSSASLLTISWMYLAMMGAAGLTRATQVAILNANYLAHRLDPFFPVLYRGPGGLVAHECVVDLRDWKSRADLDVEDVAKRLMDYGFHAPTMSWPVPGTLMIEPTESESKAELDRFCDAMIAIHAEMKAVESGAADRHNNLLQNAPHTALAVTADRWDHPYSRETAAFPAPWLRDHKFWPAVGRVDNVYGDRHLFCCCPPL